MIIYKLTKINIKMGLFDFLKSNKNIITDNGTNYIYYDNGKGSIKEKFIKINGVLNGDYVEYNINGIFNIITFKDGLITLTEEQLLIKNRKEQINKNIEIVIRNLKIIDELISNISGINLLVQMNNSKIDYFSKLIENKFNNQFDEDYIKYYLYSKRNYFIKHLIKYGECENLNNKFTENINNFESKLFFSKNQRWEDWGYDCIDGFIDQILIDNIKGEIIICEISLLELSILESCLNKNVFLQDSLLFGLNFGAYKLLHELIKNKYNEYEHYNFENEIVESDSEFLRRLINDELQLKPSKMNIYVQKVIKEIHSICINNKVNQEDIILEL